MTTLRLHLKVLNGVRSLTSIGIIWIHVHFIFGTLLYHSATPCFAALHNAPFLRAFEKPSFHLNTFWIISGFLCEYQLERLIQGITVSFAVNGTISRRSGYAVSWKEFAKFVLNRILRILPVYTAVVLLIFHGQYQRRKELVNVSYKCTDVYDVMRALTFTIDYERSSMLCAQHGWTLQNDVHGYLTLTLLAFASQSMQAIRRYKTAVYWGLYWISVATMLSRRPFDWQHLTGDALLDYRNRASGGLDSLVPDEITVADGLGVGLHTLWDVQPFDSETFAYTRHRMFQVYWSGIFGHGGSIFLGGALCSSLADNQGRPSHLFIKVIMALILLYITGAEFALSAIPVYFLLEALLCQDPNSPLAFLRHFLSLDVWTWLSPFTFGIYMIHFVVLFAWSEMTIVERATAIRDDNQPACQHYSMGIMMRQTFLCFCLSLGFSVVSYHTLELPFRRFRKKFLSRSSMNAKEAMSKKRK